MVRNPVIVFLIKVFPLFAIFLYLWHAQNLAHGYYRLLAGVLDAFYPYFDPTGKVSGVAVRGHEIGIGLIVNAQREVLSVNATDITSNTAMLMALYLASPVWRRLRAFLLFFICASVLLFSVHAATVVTLSQEAFMTHPVIMANTPFTKTEILLIPIYNLFYVEVGMYLVVLILWFPYILRCIRTIREKSREASSSTLAANHNG
jgi:hypothetical protein